jgi:hypothetical protein
MKRIRTFALCAVAALALTAAFSAVASAEPEYLTKAVVPEGSKIPLTATLGAAFLEGAVSKTKIECAAGTGGGEVTGPRTSKNSVTTFTGCKSGGFPCNSAGDGEGVIKTFPLEGKLNGLTSSLPGVRFFPEGTGRGGILAEFACAGGSIPVKVKGSVIGSISGAAGTGPETGKLLSSGKITFAEKEGIQKYLAFSEGPEKGESEQLESKAGEGAYEKGGQSVIVTLKTSPTTWGLGITK